MRLIIIMPRYLNTTAKPTIMPRSVILLYLIFVRSNCCLAQSKWDYLEQHDFESWMTQ